MTDDMETVSDFTGSVPVREDTIFVRFDRYEVGIRVGPGNEFRGITEVRVSKDFLSDQQRTQTQGYHDVSDLYAE